MDLDAWSACLKVLADPTRVRLLALLEREELTVAELSGITRLAQPRVSTHLARLKEADLVRDRRAGVSAYYRFNGDTLDPGEARLWEALRDSTDDPLLRQDAERLPAVLATRAADQNWADSVAGDMERHYSPGRTWEALARSTLPLLEPGDVLDVASGDGVLGELLALGETLASEPGSTFKYGNVSYVLLGKAIELVTDTYLKSQTFPKEEIYGLTSQIRRCAVSIPSNIAEGCGRNTDKDFNNFLGIALGFHQPETRRRRGP